MNVWVDGRERQDLSRLGSAAEILGALEAEAARSGMVIMEVRADGVAMEPEAFRDILGGREARFTLMSLRTLVRESLDEALAYSRRLRDGIESIASRFEEGKDPEARDMLTQAIDGLDWLLSAYEHCRILMSAPLVPEEEAALRSGLLSAVERLLAQAGGERRRDMARTLRQDFLPRVEMLSFRLGELSSFRMDPQ